MDQAKLVDETRVLHRELGPCVLVAKCYDLLDDYEEAKRVAAKVAKRESTDLAEMDRRRFSYSHISEQFLRTIYAFERSGQHQQAQLALRSFRDIARSHNSSGLSPDRTVASRLIIAHMLLNDTSPELLALIIGNSFERELASAWVTRDATSLSNILGRVTAQIAREEVEGGLAPTQDGWTYILQKLLRAAFGSSSRI